MIRRSDWTLALACLVLLALPATSQAALDVFLDYTNFTTRLGELTTSAGVGAFTGTEVTTIKSGIKSQLETAYSHFTVGFTETSPGGSFATVNFGLTAGAGSLGLADGIDYRNQTIADTARVYSANFAFIVESGDPRATQIDELTTALAGTAAHELGHNLGLRHHDAYGDVTFTGAAVTTGGVQNDHIMATGSTGLGEVGRETQRAFTEHSEVKLAFGAELLASTPSSTLESGDAGGTAGGAQAVSLVALPNVARSAANIIGDLSSSDVDFYSVSLAAGSLLTADINNELVGAAADTIVSIFGPDGTTLLASNDDTYYSSTEWGGGSFRSLDSILTNVPISTTDTYFVKVTGYSGDSGGYELLLHSSTAVPEPASWLVFAGLFGAWGFVRRRRRGRRSTA